MTVDLSRQIQLERRAGIVLIAAAVAALAAANSPLEEAYHHLLNFKLGPVLPKVGPLTVHALVSDGLMAVFFLLIGMEVKREFFEGKLANPMTRRLPILAAIAGMAVPALFYLVAVGFDPALARGWAIPTATDIAFAVAVLAILGTHAPPSIKVLLVSIAVVDDVGAVAIIAIFYTESVNTLALGAAAAVVALMAVMSMMGVRRSWPYLAGFAILWWLVLSSGIHATIAGVLAAMAVPLGPGEKHSTLEHLAHKIHPWVMFGIVPLFGFVSAGVHIGGIAPVLDPLPLAVLVGLLIGKQIGVFAAVRIGDWCGICCRPEGASWPQIYGASILCGVGFTMSLFIGTLAFPDQPGLSDAAKIGTFAGSLLAAVLGWAVLRACSPSPWYDDDIRAALKLFSYGHSDPPRGRREAAAEESGCPDAHAAKG